MRSLMGLAKERLRIDQPTIAVRTHPSFGRIQPAFACDCAFVDQLYSEIFWTALSERRGGLELGGAAKPETTHLAMNLLLLLAVAIPLSCCLAFLSLLAFLGVMTIGAVIHVVGIARAGRQQRPRVEPANSSAG
jgi:hypothetical protein